MIYIGCHLSVTKGYEAMGNTMSEALNTRQFPYSLTKHLLQSKKA